MYIRTVRTNVRPFAAAIFFIIALCLHASGPVNAQSQTTSATGSEIVHTVQTGDTLSNIARRYDVTVQEIAEANNLSNLNLIFVGQRLVIPIANPTPIPPTAPPPTSSPPTVPPPTVPPPTSAPPTPTSLSTESPPPTPPPSATPSPTAESGPTPTLVPTETPAPIDSPWTEPAELIEVFSPVSNTSYHSPIEINGFSRTFESTVNIRLVAQSGLVLAERFAMGGGAAGYDFFETYIRFFVNEETEATLEVFETAGEDDDPNPDVSIPITLLPSGQRAIDLLAPAVGQDICGDINLAGYSLTFEGAVPIALARRDGAQILETFTTGGGVDFRDWGTSVSAPSSSQPQPLLVSVFESSARDGSAIDTTRRPISVYPAGHPKCSQ